MGILVLDDPLPQAPLADALRRAAPHEAVWTREDDVSREPVEAIVSWHVPREVFARHPQLKLLCSVGAGVDHLLGLPGLPPHVAVTRTVDPAQGVAMAAYVLACTLPFTRGLPLYEAQRRQGRWQRHPVRAAHQWRVGVLGMGAIGQAVARAFASLGFPVAGWVRRDRRLEGIVVHAGEAGLADLLAATDILVCTLPLTPQTRGLLDRRRLVRLPRGAFVVNVGRGEHIVEADLKALLDEDHLGGAALDVFEHEPLPPDHWIWHHPKVAATPHVAAQTSPDVVAAQCIEALRCVRDGRPPPRAVDREAGY